MLLHIMRQTYVIVVIGIVFLVVFVGPNIASNNSMKEQVQNVQYLNQYRLGLVVCGYRGQFLFRCLQQGVKRGQKP